MKQFKIGLTGGIGSGKSTVTKLLEKLGVVIIDADKISRASTASGGEAIEAIRVAFGDAMIDDTGALDRAKMRELVFQEADARQRLEAIVHPIIQTHMRIQAEQATSAYVIYDIPLLIESVERYRPQFKRICVVDCDEETQISRVQSRSQLTVDEIRRIIASQASRADRLVHADDVIHNGVGVDLAELQRQVHQMHECWLELSEKG
ncbi:Dephospho-CoA kinase [Oligella ureolytica]|uniref:dephospho-CoA kinase n=1 Tax=Oligella ureolytica TaxID=90244 RepID=UPI000E08CD32|nr:dephospho-CoA kinase [Oligella ureolytica]SUA53645.1 Dephospho-CoA kinase [Oligella ureolytica]